MNQRNSLAALSLLCLLNVSALAQDKSQSPTPPAAPPAKSDAPADSAGAERVNVDTIKEKYWARGDESELGVVQNRLYSKEHKLELGVFAGIISTDPFLSVQSMGFSLGYHISEYLAVRAMAWKEWAQPSGALTSLESVHSSLAIGSAEDTNPPQAYYGGEVAYSPIYGKLSLVGKAILYYDMHLLGGLGATQTNSGTDFTQHLGIGQQVYVSKWASISFDYRAMHYNETIIEQVIPAELGQPVGNRSNWSHTLMLGVTFLFGIF